MPVPLTIPARLATRPRLTIRTLMIANLFIAVALAEVAVAVRAPIPVRAFCLYIAACAIPLTWSSLASFAMRPGPGRDAFTVVLIWIPSVLLTAFFFGLPFAVRRMPIAKVFVILGAVVGIGAVGMLAVMFPGVCPACGRRGLVRSRTSSPPARSTLLHRYGWCLRCEARLKRRRLARGRGPWVDASGPEDDAGYDLWTPAVPLRKWRSRLRRRPLRDGESTAV